MPEDIVGKRNIVEAAIHQEAEDETRLFCLVASLLDVLARAWIRVIWRCWQDHTAYDPAHHGGYKRLQITTAA